MPKDDNHRKKSIAPRNCFIDPMARIVGDVFVGQGTALWPGAVVEGGQTRVGEDVIIMPKAHLGENTSIGDRAFIAPGARLEKCTIGEDTFIGMDTIICEGAEVGESSVIAHGTVIPKDMKIPERSIVKGTPGKIEGSVTDETMRKISEVRSKLNWRKEEVKIMLKRGESLGVNDIPKRPDVIFDEFKETGEKGTIEREAKFLKMFGLEF